MSDIDEVSEITMETLRALRTGDMKRELAQEIFNGVGKRLSGFKVQLAYAALRREIPTITGLESSEPQLHLEAAE